MRAAVSHPAVTVIDRWPGALRMVGYTLRVELSDGQSFTHVVGEGRTGIGRTSSADLTLKEVGVSRDHAALWLSGGQLAIEDLGSTNGTTVNARPIAGRQVLSDGDQVGIGRAVLTVEAAGAPAQVSLAAARPLADSDTVVRDAVAPPSSGDQATLAGRPEQDEQRAFWLLYQLGRAFTADAPVGVLCERVVDLAVKALEPARAVLLVGPAGQVPQPQVIHNPSGEPFALNPAITERALAGSAVLTVDRTDTGSAADVRSVLCAPLKGSAAASSIGLLYLERPLADRRYAPRDLDLVTLLANHAAALLDNARLVEELRAARDRLAFENQELRDEIHDKFGFAGVIGDSGALQEVLRTVHKLCRADSTVLITGESGTGKELIAKTIHHNSNRKSAPFVAINCAAIPDNLIEAELFGIEKGVATGVDRRVGKFEAAGEGTLFLDEIGELPPAVQAKLLRVLEEREVERIGGRKAIPVKARILAATNRSLSAEVAAGRFREDLFYRLNVVPLRLPSLRERPQDIPALASTFLARICQEQSKRIRGFAAPALELLQTYRWPGNVRELQNEIERIVAVWEPSAHGEITADLMSPVLRTTPADSPHFAEELEAGDIKEVVGVLVERAESHLIRRALARTNGNKVAAAKVLGLTREGLRKKMIRYGME